MEKLNKLKITREVSLKDSLNDWESVVWYYNSTDYKFWEDSWNKDHKK